MKSLDSGRYAVSISVAAALLSGCSGWQAAPPNAATISGSQSGPASQSWVNPSASRGDLVYLAIYGEVFVYSYPGGKHVSTLTGVKKPVALCSDVSGNVWVIESDSHSHSRLLKYAHDGSKPIASLRLNDRADACSVDAGTGSLAVGTLNSNVAVWANGQGRPTLYSTAAFFKEVRTISYDGKGDLYMRSFVSDKSGAWLPKGTSTVMQFHITKLGSYGWDGRYFAIGPGNGFTEPLTIYKLHGGRGKVLGSVSLKNCAPGYEPSFSIAGSELAVSCGIDETNSLNYYKYPKGGNPIKTVGPGATGSVAISVAPSKNDGIKFLP
jgi:hypothetical protein